MVATTRPGKYLADANRSPLQTFNNIGNEIFETRTTTTTRLTTTRCVHLRSTMRTATNSSCMNHHSRPSSLFLWNEGGYNFSNRISPLLPPWQGTTIRNMMYGLKTDSRKIRRGREAAAAVLDAEEEEDDDDSPILYDDDPQNDIPDIHPDDSPFVIVDHGEAYERAMAGFHGQTLEKAKELGKGKDTPIFDPFLEDELTEQRLLQEEEEEEEQAMLSNGENQGKTDPDEEQLDDDDSVDDDLKITEDMDEKEKKELLSRIMYNADGSIRRKASQRFILRSGSPSGGVFAILEMAGSQFKVTHDDLLIVHRLKPLDHYKVGSIHEWNRILMVGSTHFTCIGLPFVPQARVTVQVEEITKDQKVVIFKKRRRKHSQRKRGFRRDITMLRILDIAIPPSLANRVHTPRVQPDLLSPRKDPRQLAKLLPEDATEQLDENDNAENRVSTFHKPYVRRPINPNKHPKSRSKKR